MHAIDWAAILEHYLESGTAEYAVTNATVATLGGYRYHLELFADGTWRLLFHDEAGEGYLSPGVLVPVPALDHVPPTGPLGYDTVGAAVRRRRTWMRERFRENLWRVLHAIA